MTTSTRWLAVLLGAAVAVSIVHYVDNTVRYDDYAPDGGGPITAPVVAASWFVFTAFGGWGFVRHLRGDDRTAAIGLAVYSVSGLIGLVHYRQVSPSDFDAVQNTFIVLDIVLGAAILAVACVLAWRPPARA